ncbi:MAG: hypothetical protein ACYSRR_04385 [Planctomycetota bacterium]|jgi:hypothetical protein
MNSITKLLLLSAVCIAVITFTAELAFAADPGADAADCDISVTVNQIIEWEGTDFPAINLTQIDNKTDTPSGSAAYTLWVNCNVSLTANNTASGPAELSSATSDVLKTEYYIDYDGDGAASTGGTDTTYAEYDTFISGGSAVTHVDNDGSVEVTLYARASTAEADEAPDAGAYTATQTLTASWTSD